VGRPSPAPPQAAGPASQAVEVDDHGQLRADPAHLGELTTLEGAAGHLDQGIGPALIAAAVILGTGRAGQRLQGGQQEVAGLGLQQPLEGDHALQGRGQPQAPPPMASLGLAGGGVGVDHLPQMGHRLAQPGWVQATGGLQEHQFGLGGELVREVVGAVGQDAGVGR
jgi:hypothetical protein